MPVDGDLCAVDVLDGSHRPTPEQVAWAWAFCCRNFSDGPGRLGLSLAWAVWKHQRRYDPAHLRAALKHCAEKKPNAGWGLVRCVADDFALGKRRPDAGNAPPEAPPGSTPPPPGAGIMATVGPDGLTAGQRISAYRAQLRAEREARERPAPGPVADMARNIGRSLG